MTSVTKVGICGKIVVSGGPFIDVGLPWTSTDGNYLLVFIRYGGTTINSMTQNTVALSSLVQTNWGQSPNPTDRQAEVWTGRVNITGGGSGSINVSCSFNANSAYEVCMVVAELAPGGSASSLGFSYSVAKGQQTANPPASGTTVTNVANCLLLCTLWDANDSLASSNAGSGWTADTANGTLMASVAGGSGNVNLTEEQTQSSSGSYTAAFGGDLSKVSDWCCHLIGIQPS